MSYRDTPEFRRLEQALRDFCAADDRNENRDPDYLVDFVIITANVKPDAMTETPYGIYVSSLMPHVTRGLLHEALTILDFGDDDDT